jgi:hypothetical protein
MIWPMQAVRFGLISFPARKREIGRVEQALMINDFLITHKYRWIICYCYQFYKFTSERQNIEVNKV